jgi:hypothetical protein
LAHGDDEEHTAGRETPLDFDQDMPVQRRTWVVQRVGWVAMSLLVLAALTGLCGGGPLSAIETRDDSGRLRIAYERFVRYGSAATLRIWLHPESPGELLLHVDRALLDAGSVRSMVPEPTEATAAGAHTVLRYRAVGGEPLLIRIAIEYEKVGLVRGRIALAGAGAARLSQFVYP